MPNVSELAGKAGDQVAGAIKRAEEATVTAVSTVSDLVANVIPQLPALPIGVPQPKQVVETGFKVAEKVLKAQKSYALNVAKALEPITLKVARNGRKAAK